MTFFKNEIKGTFDTFTMPIIYPAGLPQPLSMDFSLKKMRGPPLPFFMFHVVPS